MSGPGVSGRACRAHGHETEVAPRQRMAGTRAKDVHRLQASLSAWFHMFRRMKKAANLSSSVFMSLPPVLRGNAVSPCYSP